MLRQFIILMMVFTLASCSNGAKTYIIETSEGNMTMQLLESTPKHKENFDKLVKAQYYDDLLFHRVIKGFMIQGGDPNSRNSDINTSLGSGGPGYTVPAEIGTPHFKGMVSAARLGGPSNPGKESSGSQFYIVQGNPVTDGELDAMEKAKNFKYSPAQRAKYLKIGGTPMLDGDYTVFGEVIDGLEVIDKIADKQTNHQDRPVENVKMKIRAK